MASNHVARHRLGARLLGAFLAVTLVSVGAHAAAANPDAAAVHTFHIAAGPLSRALNQFTAQSGLQVLFNPSLVQGHHAARFDGRASIRAVLDALLRNSGFTYEFTDTSTVVIEPLPAARPRRSSPSSARAGKGQDNVLRTLGTITVKGTEDLTATRANIPLREIPQSVQVISQETLDQQNATDVTSALNYATGIQMVQDTAQDTYIYSRGFLVDSIHIDGGAPVRVNLGGVGVTSLDLAEYDGLEVLRGSDALFGGMGNPSATISLHRKEPTATPQAQFDASAGSWNQYRLVGDVSGPLNSSGSLSGRLVVSGDDQDYYYNIADQRKRLFYGILKYDLGPSTTLEFGGSYQTNHGINDFEGLPRYDNGVDPHLPRWLALTAPWAREDNTFVELFAKLDHHFNDNWRLQIHATQLNQHTPEDTSAGYAGPISSTTGLLASPLTATVGSGSDKQQMADAILTGSFTHESEI